MEGVYDLRRGLLHERYFGPDGCVAEITMFDQVLPSLPNGSLLGNLTQPAQGLASDASTNRSCQRVTSVPDGAYQPWFPAATGLPSLTARPAGISVRPAPI
jgi:hypothetical protein